MVQSDMFRLVDQTIVNVLKRPRFGISVKDPHTQTEMQTQRKFEKDGFVYNLSCSSSKSHSFIVVTTTGWEGPGVFYSLTVKHSKMPNLRRVGATIANKAKMRLFHSVTTE